MHRKNVSIHTYREGNKVPSRHAYLNLNVTICNVPAHADPTWIQGHKHPCRADSQHTGIHYILSGLPTLHSPIFVYIDRPHARVVVVVETKRDTDTAT